MRFVSESLRLTMVLVDRRPGLHVTPAGVKPSILTGFGNLPYRTGPVPAR